MLWKTGLLFLFVFLFTGEAQANICLDFSGQNNTACKASYKYESEWIYFNNSQVGEQKFFVERVVNKSNNVVENADFQFSGDCSIKNKCHLAPSDFVDVYMKALRQETAADRLYRYRECDPTRESC